MNINNNNKNTHTQQQRTTKQTNNPLITRSHQIFLTCSCNQSDHSFQFVCCLCAVCVFSLFVSLALSLSVRQRPFTNTSTQTPNSTHPNLLVATLFLSLVFELLTLLLRRVCLNIHFISLDSPRPTLSLQTTSHKLLFSFYCKTRTIY